MRGANSISPSLGPKACRLMCDQRHLGLLGVGHYLPGQEIHLGDLRHAQLMQSPSGSNKVQTLKDGRHSLQKIYQEYNKPLK